MKTLKNQFKRLALFLSLLILFQGCVAYKAKNYSLDDAVASDTNVKLRTSNNVIHKYKRIELKDDAYYGVKKEKGTIVKYPIDSKNISDVKIKDKTLSTIGTITFGLVGTFGVLVAIYLLAGGGAGIGFSGPIF